MKSVHEREKVLSSDICRYTLSHHLKAAHKGEKSFSCDICHNSFSQKSSLSQSIQL